MKKILLSILLVALLFSVVPVILIACQRDEITLLESVTISDIEVGAEVALEVKSAVFDLQGNSVVGYYLVGNELVALLEELEIDLPEIPSHEFTFKIELVSYEFEHEIENSNEDTRVASLIPLNDTIVAVDNDLVNFQSISFEHAGIFTYRITQLIEEIDNELEDEEVHYTWSYSDDHLYFTVQVNEDMETETLTAVVEQEDMFIFVNTFTYDVSESVGEVILLQWEERIALAYEEGYEYIMNADGEYMRVALEQNETSTNSSRIPEDDAVTISYAEALSYLALVNRHFRLSSTFSPADLSEVNVSSIMGTHLMRSTAARAAENLFQAANSEGNHVLVATSGYRSYATQLATHNHWISTMGESEARRVSARAGHSEHQLGLALDVTTHALGGLSQQFSTTAEGQWVGQNAHRFGFIIRYPANREADTGFIYEPWHLRYIGVDAATQIFENGMILEEFLEIN